MKQLEDAALFRRFPLPLLITLASFTSTAWAAAANAKVDFDRDVRPIFADNCFACHGPDEKRRMAQLRFDTKEGAFAKAGVIVAGDPAKSRLVSRITAADKDTRIPPPYAQHNLTEKQVATI